MRQGETPYYATERWRRPAAAVALVGVVALAGACSAQPSKVSPPRMSCDKLAVSPVKGNPNTYNFDPSVSVSGNAKVTSVQYDFGNGTVRTEAYPLGDVPTYHFDEPGTFMVSVEPLGKIAGRTAEIKGCEAVVRVPSS